MAGKGNGDRYKQSGEILLLDLTKSKLWLCFRNGLEYDLIRLFEAGILIEQEVQLSSSYTIRMFLQTKNNALIG